MDKSETLKKLFTKKTRDYTYAIAFFFIFSFFVLFVIRPNILSVVSAQAKIEQLKIANSVYDGQIERVINLQSILESSREDLQILRQAIASSAEVKKLFSDIYVSIEESKLESEKVELGEVNLKKTGNNQNTIKSLTVKVNVNGDFEGFMEFMNNIYNQRRLKRTKSFSISRGDDSTQSARLKMKIEVEAFEL